MFEAGMVQTLVEGVRDTLYMVLASTAFGYLLGLPLGILLCITGENGIRSRYRRELDPKRSVPDFTHSRLTVYKVARR